MKFYKIAEDWYQSLMPDGTGVDLYLNRGQGSILSTIPQAKLGESVGQEITREEFLIQFNKIVKNYESYFESERDHSLREKCDHTQVQRSDTTVRTTSPGSGYR